MITISTLQDHLDYDHGMILFCQCGHSKNLSLPKLIEIFGPDFETVRHREHFLSRFRCVKCGARPNTVQITTLGVPRW